MHSKDIGKTLFVFNGDFSGNIQITRDGCTVEVPGVHLLEFVAGWVADEKIAQLEQASPSEILGIKIGLPEVE